MHIHTGPYKYLDVCYQHTYKIRITSKNVFNGALQKHKSQSSFDKEDDSEEESSSGITILANAGCTPSVRLY